MVQFDYNPSEKKITCKFIGRMDTQTVDRLSQSVQINILPDENSEKDSVVFDLEEVDYISSSFIRICVLMAKQTGPGKFSIIKCSPFVKKTFKVAGLDDSLRIS